MLVIWQDCSSFPAIGFSGRWYKIKAGWIGLLAVSSISSIFFGKIICYICYLFKKTLISMVLIKPKPLSKKKGGSLPGWHARLVTEFRIAFQVLTHAHLFRPWWSIWFLILENQKVGSVWDQTKPCTPLGFALLC